MQVARRGLPDAHEDTAACGAVSPWHCRKASHAASFNPMQTSSSIMAARSCEHARTASTKRPVSTPAMSSTGCGRPHQLACLGVGGGHGGEAPVRDAHGAAAGVRAVDALPVGGVVDLLAVQDHHLDAPHQLLRLAHQHGLRADAPRNKIWRPLAPSVNPSAWVLRVSSQEHESFTCMNSPWLSAAAGRCQRATQQPRCRAGRNHESVSHHEVVFQTDRGPGTRPTRNPNDCPCAKIES